MKKFMPRLRGVLALIFNWGDSSGIKLKPFGFGSVFCWIEREIMAAGCRLGLPGLGSPVEEGD